METLIGINQSEPILGGDPPRQQLCIVDSIWAAAGGPVSSITDAPLCLVMGTFGPIVDYLTAKKLREGNQEDYQMGITNTDDAVVNEMLNTRRTHVLCKGALYFYRCDGPVLLCPHLEMADHHVTGLAVEVLRPVEHQFHRPACLFCQQHGYRIDPVLVQFPRTHLRLADVAR